jgi:hypothetical protein
MNVSSIQVLRKSFAESRVETTAFAPLAQGEVLVRIDKFALTANNVSYALSGDMIGYWKFFPAEEPWGIVPVWGFGDVEQSNNPSIAVGERIYGFVPMASHVVLKPDHVTDGGFTDSAAHRAALPAIYNSYQRTSGGTSAYKALEDQRCVLFPLFSTSFLLYDYLVDNAFFGAEQVLVSSASSKTGLGLCNLLSRHGEGRPRVVGLTSPRNLEFVRSLGACDCVLCYDQIAAMDGSVPSALIDMSGAGDVIGAIHATFGENLKLSSSVGATHWEAGRFRGENAATPHAFFFAPGQFLKREQEWGPGEVMRRAYAEAARMSLELQGTMEIQHHTGRDAVSAAWRSMVANETPPNVAVMASLS